MPNVDQRFLHGVPGGSVVLTIVLSHFFLGVVEGPLLGGGVYQFFCCPDSCSCQSHDIWWS